MFLTVHEQERLMVYTAGKLAMERRERGLRLNLPEATAILTSFLLEGARDGHSVADLMEAERHVLAREDVMEGAAGARRPSRAGATHPHAAQDPRAVPQRTASPAGSRRSVGVTTRAI